MRNVALTLGVAIILFAVGACSDTANEPQPAAGGATGAGGSTTTDSGGACADEVRACDPFYVSTQAKCPDPRQNCYAKSDGTTICACPSDTPGPQNAPCFSGPGDCQQGFVCVSETCRTLCDPAVGSTTCEGSLPCNKLGTSNYGACGS